jgi:hypothetical protein
MKKINYLLFTLLLSIQAFSQPYLSIFKADTVQWNVFEYAADAGGTLVYSSFSDTIINTKKYHIIYRDMWRSEPNINPDFDRVHGFVREDTLSGKYWFMDFDDIDTSEVLLMDIGLNKSDTFFTKYPYKFLDDYMIVDTVYFIEKKKIIQFDNYMYSFSDKKYPIRFIEGIGAEIGFYFNEQEVANNYSLLCKKEDGLIKYRSEINSNDNCFHQGAASIKDINTSLDINIYPIPAENYVTIEIPDIFSDKYFYKVIDSKGDIVANGQIISRKTVIEPSQNGLYYVHVHNSKFAMSKAIVIF